MFDFIGSAFGYIVFFGYKISGLYVVGLILFTIAVKLVLFPLSIKQQKTTAKQQRLGPKMQELKERYGNDKQKFSEAQMELYQKEGVSPMGGCLPLLLQFPIIIGLYAAVIKPLTCVLHIGADVVNQAMSIMGIGTTGYYEIEMIHKFPQYITQLTEANIFTPEQLSELGSLSNGAFNLFGLDLLGTPSFTNILILIPILCLVSSMATSMISMRISSSASQPANGCMKWGMPLFMSIFSTVIAFSVPGAVGVYWILSNLFSIAQSYALNHFYNAGILNAKDEAARLARRRQEEAAIVTGLPQIDVLRIAAEKKAQDQKPLEKPVSGNVQQKNEQQAPRNSGQKVIKTGNAARANNTAGTKKKKK